jgi:hypothetical protein
MAAHPPVNRVRNDVVHRPDQNVLFTADAEQ